MAIDIKGLELAIINAVRIAVGDDLSTVNENIALWTTTGTGVVVNPNHIFSGQTLDEVETLRNDYFLANPSELVLGVQCTLNVTDVNPIKQTWKEGKAAVIRSREYDPAFGGVTPTFPDYPYASVDYTRLTDEGYELTERLFDEDDNYIYRTHKLATFSVRFFGTSQYDAMSICNKMHMILETDGIRAIISTLAPNEARIRSKSDPVFVASAMEDKYREVASFDIMLAVLDEVIIPAGEDGSDYIENIILDTTVPQNGVQGGLYKADEETPDLHVNVETKVTYP